MSAKRHVNADSYFWQVNGLTQWNQIHQQTLAATNRQQGQQSRQTLAHTESTGFTDVQVVVVFSGSAYNTQ